MSKAAKQATEPTTEAATDEPTTDAPEDGGKAPAWQAADYSGPLTIEQALWRNERMRTK